MVMRHQEVGSANVNQEVVDDIPKGVFDSSDASGTGRAGFIDRYTIPNASREQAFSVINDVAQYPKFLKIYSKTQVLSDNVDPENPNQRLRIARYDIAIPFILRPFFNNLHYTLKLYSTFDPATQTESMWWEQIEGPSFLVDNCGRWDVKEVGKDVEISLEMNLGYRFYLPQNMKKFIMHYILKDSMNNIQKRVLEVLGRHK